MLPLTFFRSSLINNVNFCEQQMFMNYVLGLYQKSNKKSEMGTIVHKVLELLALCKKELQSKTTYQLIDNNIGLDISINLESLLKEKQLTNIEIDKVNSTRINKDVYKWDCYIKQGHIRYGTELVEYLIPKCYEYYKNNSENEWKNIDLKNITNFIWIVLDYQNGAFDPRKKNIYSTESYFDLEITEDWANYAYDYRGRELEGNLRLKGTIDLTVQVDENTLEFIDYKSGQRLDWNTGEIKTYKKLHEDPQLLTYFYAGKNLYPNKNIITSIFFIRDGGPYTICFDDSDMQKSIKLFKNTFEQTKRCKLPVLLDPSQKNFKCKSICDYYKQKVGNTNMCLFIHNEIQKHGLDYVITKYSREGFFVDNYEAPGEV